MSSADPRAKEIIARLLADIDAFRRGKLKVDSLSADLKVSLAALEEFADPDWVDELRTLRNQVEYVNAFFIRSGRGELDADERRMVDEALDELEAELTIS